MALESASGTPPASGTPSASRAEPAAAFEGARAFEHLKRQVGMGPRVPGTKAHARTRDWIAATLKPLADAVTIDTFTVDGVGAEGVPFANVIARFQPFSTARVLLFAHWDTRPRAEHDLDPTKRALPVPGANDGASGTAVLVELARLFHARPPAIGVDLVFLDGEDWGAFEAPYRSVLLGAQRYAATYRGPKPRFGILLDMVGDRDLRLLPEQNSLACCAATVEKVWKVAAELGYSAVFASGPGPAVIDDHLPLNAAGLGVIDLIDVEYPAWHTTRDLPDQTSAKSLEAVGRVVAEVVYRERAQ